VNARQVPSPNHDDRPAGTEITLLVLHSISLPRGHYGGEAIERLFCNTLDTGSDPAFAALAGLRVSSHFLIRRDGELVQFVPVGKRAWHAGVSRWRGRERCNDFSIGIELEGTDDTAFAPAQYPVLYSLIRELGHALPLREVAAHSDLAPARKTDPGAGFRWDRLLRSLAGAY